MRVSTKVVIDLETGAVLEREAYDYAGPVELARGAKQQQKLATQEYGAAGKLRQEEQATRRESRGRLLPSIEEFQKSEGYTPEEKAGIAGTTAEAAAQPFESATQDIQNQAARTRNAAGVPAALALAAREKSSAMADTSRGLGKMFADERTKRRMAGAQMAGQLYGVDANLLARMAGLPAEALQVRGQTVSPGVSLGPLGSWT